MNRSADFEGRFGGHEDNIKVHFTGALRLEQTLVIVVFLDGDNFCRKTTITNVFSNLNAPVK